MPELRLIPAEAGAYRAAVQALHAEGQRRLVITPRNDLSAEVARIAGDLGCDARVADPMQPAGGAASSVIVTETEPAALSTCLHALIDLEDGVVVAPRTRLAHDARPLFLISIPKAGTHLLYGLARAFGYHDGVVCPEWPNARHWYCLEYSNSHTRADDFFIDTVRRSPFGNRHHPFATSPALFIYRNPLDILVSEANYYHRDGNAIFGGYLGGRSFEERLLTLIDDPWLFGSFRDRMAGFVPWLEFPNVVALSFEELVGSRGGGDDAIQRRLIWSLQLKLHVPGDPAKIAARLFDPASPTFNEGRIGASREKMTEAAMRKFRELPQDFMKAFGYAASGDGSRMPARAEEFRRRPLLTGEETFWNTPLLMETHVNGRNIVRYQGRFYGPRNENLAGLGDAQLARLPSARGIEPLRWKLALRAAVAGDWLRGLARRLRGTSRGGGEETK